MGVVSAVVVMGVVMGVVVAVEVMLGGSRAVQHSHCALELLRYGL